MCYVSENNIYITSNYYEDSDVSRTLIRKISYTDGKLAGVAQTKIKGMLNDSFSIDEYEGNLRLVTTIDEIYSNDDIMPLNETADETADKSGTTDKSDASKVTEKAVTENVKDAVPGTNSLYVLNDKLEDHWLHSQSGKRMKQSIPQDFRGIQDISLLIGRWIHCSR